MAPPCYDDSAVASAKALRSLKGSLHAAVVDVPFGRRMVREQMTKLNALLSMNLSFRRAA